jgi:hypothetical protein
MALAAGRDERRIGDLQQCLLEADELVRLAVQQAAKGCDLNRRPTPGGFLLRARSRLPIMLFWSVLL